MSKCRHCDSTRPTHDDIERLHDEIEHLREGLDAYRSVLSIRGDRVPYSIVDNKNLLYVKTWEQIEKVRQSSR